MKGRVWEKFAKEHLLPHLPGFRVKGTLLYQEPVDWVLRFFLADTSATSTDYFYFTVAVQPLYVPRDYLVLSLGYRAEDGRGAFVLGDRDEMAERLLAHIRQEDLAFLERHGSPASLLEHDWWKDPIDPNSLEWEAYSLILVNRTQEAARVLAEAVEYRHPSPNFVMAPWDHEVMARCREMAGLLEQGVDVARLRLDEYRRSTLAALRLPDA